MPAVAGGPGFGPPPPPLPPGHGRPAGAAGSGPGRALGASPPVVTLDAGSAGGGDKGVMDFLQEAFSIYRRNGRVLLASAAVVFVPGALTHAIALAAVPGQAAVLDSSTLMSLVAAMISGFIFYGIAVPLTQAALTLAAADRLVEGGADWKEIAMRLAGRVVVLVTALAPAALAIGVGFLFLFIPGLILSLLFAFVPVVALVERRGGIAALKRSYELVRADWLRVAILIAIFVLARLIISVLIGLMLPARWIFLGRLLEDGLTLLVLPIPTIAGLLLYLDILRRRDDLDRQQLHETLETLAR
jgi:hypothetical protein